MNKFIVPLTVVSVIGLFNAYSSFAQPGQKASQAEKQAKKQKACGIASKESCCKTEKAKPGNCCACCTGSTCAARSDSHCCG